MTTEIPWRTQDQWQALTLFFNTIQKEVGQKDLVPVSRRASAICQLFAGLSRPMDDLCAATCISCREICCERATIWYDWKDLVYLYFAFGRLPSAQITRVERAGGKRCCVHFSNTGCTLSRLERPFVCTWYLCPEQKKISTSRQTGDGETLLEKIAHIKRLRREMTSRFRGISADGLPVPK